MHPSAQFKRSHHLPHGHRKVLPDHVTMAIYALWFIRGPVHNAFDASSIHYEGKWEGVGPWKSRLFWALWNSKSKNKYGKRDIAMAHGCCVCWRGPKNLSSSTVQKEWKIHRKQGYKEGVSSVQIKVQFSPDCIGMYSGTLSFIRFWQLVIQITDPT